MDFYLFHKPHEVCLEIREKEDMPSEFERHSPTPTDEFQFDGGQRIGTSDQRLLGCHSFTHFFSSFSRTADALFVEKSSSTDRKFYSGTSGGGSTAAVSDIIPVYYDVVCRVTRFPLVALDTKTITMN